jgi:hypothetical protein
LFWFFVRVTRSGSFAGWFYPFWFAFSCSSGSVLIWRWRLVARTAGTATPRLVYAARFWFNRLR